MIEGTVETLDEQGVFRGWLRDTRDPVPALIQIRLDGEVIAEALAGAFRRDLLRGGHGHGHYGFLARTRVTLPPGPAMFTLFLPRHGQGIPVRLTVPPIPPPSRLPVEALLAPESAWEAADLAGALRCLDLPAQCRAMGTRRFVDVGFRLVLQRWPKTEEAAVFIRAIEEEDVEAGGTQESGSQPAGTGAEEFLAELLASRERADLPAALPSPWDSTFPFAALTESA